MAANATGTPGTAAIDPATGRQVGTYDANGRLVTQAMSAGAVGLGSTYNNGATASTTNGNTAQGTTSTPDDMTPLTGWMAGYLPGAASNIYNNPQDILADVMAKNGGYSAASPLFQQVSQLSGADPLTLYMLSQGAGATALGDQNVDAYGNYLGSMYLNQLTPGGNTFNFSNMMSNLFGMGNTGADGEASTAPLYNLLTAGDASDQVQNVYNMVRDAARVGLNPLAAQAALTSVERQGTDYRRDVMTGKAGTDANSAFFQYLNQNNPSLVAALTGGQR